MKIYFSILFFLIGSILASFYGVVALRLPLGKSIVKPRSHCDNCNHYLSWYELIPIFSYFITKGKCKHCKQQIASWQPLTEAVTGFLFMASYLYYGIGYQMYMCFILISLSILIFISDFKYMIILDSPLVIAGILIFILKWLYFDINTALISLASGFGLFLFMLLIGFIGSKIFKREALGGGDIKLSFIIGMTVSLPHGFLVLILSTFLALPYATISLLSKTSREVPFGPFLIGALCIVFIYFDKFTYILKLMNFVN